MKQFYIRLIIVFLCSPLISAFAQEESEKVKLLEVQLFMVRVENETPIGGRTSKKIIYSLNIYNLYLKQIDNFRGLITIKNLYGETLKIFRIDYNSSYYKKIPARKPGGIFGASSFDYKEIFNSDDKKDIIISTIDLNQCDISWKTEYIHFTNGTDTFKDEYILRTELKLKK